jgi:activator of 2-hydroxyglutaryl-CoA dehydratase
LADNKKLPDIVHGINKAVAAKIFSLLQRLGPQEPYMMTGGVAYNAGVVQAIESLLGQKLVIGDNPQVCGALGAAVIAADF